MTRAQSLTGSEADRVAASLDALAGMDAVEFDRRWRQVFGAASPPSLPPAQRAQVIAYRAARRGSAAPTHLPVPDRRGHTPGVMLSCEWAGVMHTVQVMDAGYAWNGATYDSLSRGAKAITGTKWNVPRFFGLRANANSDVSARLESGEV